MLGNRWDATVSVLITNPTEVEKLQATGSGSRVRIKYRTRTRQTMDGWTAGPGDEYEDGQVAVLGGHRNRGNRAKLAGQSGVLCLPVP